MWLCKQNDLGSPQDPITPNSTVQASSSSPCVVRVSGSNPSALPQRVKSEIGTPVALHTKRSLSRTMHTDYTKHPRRALNVPIGQDHLGINHANTPLQLPTPEVTTTDELNKFVSVREELNVVVEACIVTLGVLTRRTHTKLAFAAA